MAALDAVLGLPAGAGVGEREVAAMRRKCLGLPADAAEAAVAVGERLSFCCTPLYLIAGVSMVVERERQQNDSAVNG